MDVQEIRRLLEKARFELPVISTNIPTRKLIGESLDLLEQQPTASEYTKRIRTEPYDPKWKHTVILRTEDRDGLCDRLDTAETRLKVLPDLLEACRPFARLADMIPAPDAPEPQWEKLNTAIRALPLDRYREAQAAIAKATKEG